MVEGERRKKKKKKEDVPPERSLIAGRVSERDKLERARVALA